MSFILLYAYFLFVLNVYGAPYFQLIQYIFIWRVLKALPSFFFIPSFIYLFDNSSIYSFFHTFRISFIHSSISLQTEFHFLIFIVCFSRDRFRTVVNVLGDAIGAGIVGHLSRDELKNADQADMEEGGQGDEKHELLVPSEGRYVKKDPDQNYSPRMTSFKRSSEE